MRLALSKSAAELLAEPRVRRLLEIELDDAFRVSPGFAGHLADDVVLIWIDVPVSGQALIQVRGGRRPLGLRRLSVDAKAADVAARYVVITAADLVRAAVRPEVRRATPPPPRAVADPDVAEAMSRSIEVTGGLTGAFVPSIGASLGGATLSVALRQEGLSERMFLRALAGSGDTGPLGWIEAGTGLGYAKWLGRGFRASAGFGASLVSVNLTERWSFEDDDANGFTLSAGFDFGVDARLADRTWLGLSLQPKWLLTPLAAHRGASTDTVEGAFLGLDLRLGTDLLFGGK